MPLFSSRNSRVLVMLILFLSSITIRIYDLTDLPLDFHPTRQLLSLIRARGLYYETQPDGYPTWKLESGIKHMQLKADIEPVVYERLVAFTYRYTGEHTWIARIYSSMFWMIASVFLFLILKEFVLFEGAFLSTVYFLIFPYAIIASRSFQPDILMLTLTFAFWWVFLRWIKSPNWTNTLLSGVLGGFAILIKFPAVFFIVGGGLGLALSQFDFRDLFRNIRMWVIGILGVTPATIYIYFGVVRGRLATEFSGNFVASLMFDAFNYIRWETKASLAAGGIFIMLGLLGVIFVQNKQHRYMLIGLWAGYFVFGLYFNYHIGTHDYYSIPLIAIVALSLAPLGEMILGRLGDSISSRWKRSAVYVVLLFGLFSILWDVRNEMKSVDYRPEAKMWAEIGEKLNYERGAVALTEDYGSRIQYFGWTTVTVWPLSGDIYASRELPGIEFNFEKEYERRTQSNAYFLVTDFEDLSLQPQLQARLAELSIYAQGDGYVIYDLGQ